MLDTDYVKKPTFIKNFWDDFKALLGRDHTIRSFEKIDFTPIYEWHVSEKERKKNLSKEEKRQIKEEKETVELKYKTAMIDGRSEQIGNFRVEPPGLFRGRGEHPKMGKIKKRIYPRDVTINLSKGAPIPEHPYPGQDWRAITHDSTVTWLAYWKDPINPRDSKYVFLSATSTFKSESDLEKFQKARKLKLHIDRIRTKYKEDWNSGDMLKRQMGTALYFIDYLALRAGHEKDEDAADTVENVECLPPKTIKLDFLGKDSIQYENRVEVEQEVFRNVQQFCQNKEPGDQLFDLFDAQALNKELKSLMDGLSVKVFRTFNASLTLQKHLPGNLEDEESIDRKKLEYDAANKKVAVLCNHQRAVPKMHDAQMEKLTERMTRLEADIAALDDEILKEKSGKLRKRRDKKADLLEKCKTQIENKESLKTVALGTSKINYLDPRITVAWCKRNEMPIEKVFTKTLLQKFSWAMTVSSDFEF
eukprot:g7841.t1